MIGQRQNCVPCRAHVICVLLRCRVRPFMPRIGRGHEIPQPPDPADRALCRRRRDRCGGAAAAAGHGKAARPADPGHQPGRRLDHARHPSGRARGARRPHHRIVSVAHVANYTLLKEMPYAQSDFIPITHGDQHAERAGGQSRAADQVGLRADRLHQGAARARSTTAPSGSAARRISRRCCSNPRSARSCRPSTIAAARPPRSAS